MTNGGSSTTSLATSEISSASSAASVLPAKTIDTQTNKKKNSKEESKSGEDTQMNANKKSSCCGHLVVRGPCYLFSCLLLFFVTVMILVAYFTNNWQTTLGTPYEYNANSMQEYYTSGLWFTCRHVNVNWSPKQSDKYCGTYNFQQSITLLLLFLFLLLLWLLLLFRFHMQIFIRFFLTLNELNMRIKRKY